jgi:hypothetical protein
MIHPAHLSSFLLVQCYQQCSCYPNHHFSSTGKKKETFALEHLELKVKCLLAIEWSPKNFTSFEWYWCLIMRAWIVQLKLFFWHISLCLCSSRHYYKFTIFIYRWYCHMLVKASLNFPVVQSYQQFSYSQFIPTIILAVSERKKRNFAL